MIIKLSFAVQEALHGSQVGLPMLDISSLIDDHTDLDAMADRLIACARTGPATPAACRAMMMALGDRLERHLRQEAELLGDDAHAAIQTVFDAEVAAFHEEFAELPDCWRTYLSRWDEPRIADNRMRYVGETADLMTVLKLRIARENEVLYPLALEWGRIAADETQAA